MKPSPPAKASTRRCAAACSFLHRWPPRPADHARSAWTSLPQRTKLLPWLGHTNHTDDAIVGTGCCGDWCRCAKGNGPPPERTSPGKHCRPVGVVPDRDVWRRAAAAVLGGPATHRHLGPDLRS